VEVVAVATAHQETADAVAGKFGVPRAYAGYEALCADPDVDLVDVATRPSRHVVMVEAALAAGKHVLCEAPLAPSAVEGAALVEAAARAGLAGVVDMQSRFWPGLSELRRLVRDGFVGRVDNLAATAFYPTFTRPEAAAASGWCAVGENGASSLRVHGLHTVDLVRWIAGELHDVRGVVTTRQPTWPGPDGPLPADSVDSAAFVARTADGAICSVHTSWVAPAGAGWRLVVHGSGGVLIAEADGHTGHFPVRLTGWRAGATGRGDLTPHVDGADVATYPFARLVERVAAHLTSGGDPAAIPDVPSFDDGLAALRIADDVERS
jgi:predicted dehydrogenase